MSTGVLVDRWALSLVLTMVEQSVEKLGWFNLRLEGSDPEDPVQAELDQEWAIQSLYQSLIPNEEATKSLHASIPPGLGFAEYSVGLVDAGTSLGGSARVSLVGLGEFGNQGSEFVHLGFVDGPYSFDFFVVNEELTRALDSWRNGQDITAADPASDVDPEPEPEPLESLPFVQYINAGHVVEEPFAYHIDQTVNQYLLHLRDSGATGISCRDNQTREFSSPYEWVIRYFAQQPIPLPLADHVESRYITQTREKLSKILDQSILATRDALHADDTEHEDLDVLRGKLTGLYEAQIKIKTANLKGVNLF